MKVENESYCSMFPGYRDDTSFLLTIRSSEKTLMKLDAYTRIICGQLLLQRCGCFKCDKLAVLSLRIGGNREKLLRFFWRPSKTTVKYLELWLLSNGVK